MSLPPAADSDALHGGGGCPPRRGQSGDPVSNWRRARGFSSPLAQRQTRGITTPPPAFLLPVETRPRRRIPRQGSIRPHRQVQVPSPSAYYFSSRTRSPTTDMGHKTRHRRQRQRLRSAQRQARMFEPGRESSEESSTTSTSSPPTSQGPRILTLGVKGGWQMGFHFSGVAVPADLEVEPEQQMLGIGRMNSP